MAAPLPYTIVIATYDRAGVLADALASVEAQTRSPAEVRIVDSSPNNESQVVAARFAERLPVTYERATRPSAAAQRNQGAAGVATPLVAFIDDDVVLAPDLFDKLCGAFDEDAAERIGGIAARQIDAAHPQPRGLLWLDYRIQAGYADGSYGARLFGPGINCLPCYTAQPGTLVRADWLNAGCVMFRTPLFHREQFPAFTGYSFAEDVHLSARIARTHELYFHATAQFEHFPSPSIFKNNLRALARERIKNQRALGMEVLGLSGLAFEGKLMLHRLFASVSILRRRERGWADEILGTWLP